MTSNLKPALAGIALSALGAASALAGGNCQGSHCYRLVTTPAEYGTVSEQVMVSPERRIPRYVPGVYDTVHEKVMVRPERAIAHHVPAQVQTVAEKVMVAPARKVWQVTRGPHGEPIGCWVEIPAQYAVQHRQVVVREASVRHEVIPAEYAVRARKVMVPRRRRRMRSSRAVSDRASSGRGAPVEPALAAGRARVLRFFFSPQGSLETQNPAPAGVLFWAGWFLLLAASLHGAQEKARCPSGTASGEMRLELGDRAETARTGGRFRQHRAIGEHRVGRLANVADADNAFIRDGMAGHILGLRVLLRRCVTSRQLIFRRSLIREIGQWCSRGLGGQRRLVRLARMRGLMLRGDKHSRFRQGRGGRFIFPLCHQRTPQLLERVFLGILRVSQMVCIAAPV